MAVDGGYGTKGYPKFDPNGAPEPWIDLEAVAAYAAKVGNRRVGTRAQREALSVSTTVADQRWEGLAFFETDFDLEWRYQNGAWRQVSPWGGLKSGNTDSSGRVNVPHPLGTAPSIVQVSMHFLSGADAVAAIMNPIVWDVDATNIQIRFARTDTGAFAGSGQPVAFMLAAWL